MGINIFTDNDTAIKKVFPKDIVFIPVSGMSKNAPGTDDITFLDIPGVIDAIIKRLKNCCKNLNWGIYRPKRKRKGSGGFFL